MIELSPSDRLAAASEVGIHEQYLYQILTGRKPATPALCPAIERALNAAVTCEQLRPDITWVRIADPEWPHAAGRPCIDVAAPAAHP